MFMKIALRIALALVLVVVLAAAGAWGYLQRSLPRIDGEIALRGLEDKVEVVRDKEGVPHIFARSARDGWFALGFVHAQDRLWQMEFQRRIGQGRLAEVLGERAFDVDRLMRTLGIARWAARIAAHLDPQTRASVDAYAAGINAFLATDPVLPIEFLALRVKPEPWKAEDTVAWLLVMAYDLSSNWRSEITRVRLTSKLGEKRAGEILPPYPGDNEPPLPDFRALYAEWLPQAEGLLAMAPHHEESFGSNSWVVSGAHSVTGKPLLANDPHLGLQAPSLWYLAHIATPAGNVVGGTLPGVPFVVLGHNNDLAWSMTTTNGDTQDLYVERVAPGDPKSYATPTGTARFEVRDETIRVGREERHIRVRTTRHGPVISDAVKSAAHVTAPGYVLALDWAALTEDDEALRAGLRLNAARNKGELIDALKDATAPQQNIVWADREGDIGFLAPARVPVRAPGNAAMGRVPVPGWDALYDWQGFIPFEALPLVENPPSGTIVTANQKITPPGYVPFISYDWAPPYRARRIEELLAQTPKHSVQSFARIQADNQSQLARDVLPFALAAKPATDAGRQVQALLTGWNASTARELAAPLAFEGWYRELTRLVYADELGSLFRESWELRAQFITAVLRNDDGQSRWCDDIHTSAIETCAMLSARAFDLAAEHLERRFGPIKNWRWGRAHFATGDHRPFGFVPLLAPYFNVTPQTSGDSYSVNVGHFFVRDEERPFANRHAPSLRAIYDLADLDRSLYMQSTGQSGNVLSPWYANLAERWAKVEYITIPTKRAAIAAAHTLVLRPLDRGLAQ